MNGYPVLPLRVDVPNLGPLQCERALRILPGRRWTLAGVLEQGRRPVVAKLFLAGRRARRHFERERRGLEVLHQRGIAAPEVLYSGTVDVPHGWLVLTAWLSGASADTLGEAALPAVVRAVALQHAEGIEQRDAHLGNFLIRDGVAWTLDGAGIHAAGSALSTARARRNFVLWLAQFPPTVDARLGDWYALYRMARWDSGRIGPRAGLRALLARARRKREARQLDKALRTCTTFEASRGFGRFCVLDRRDDSPALRALLADPDAAFAAPQTEWLKRGNTASVVRLVAGGRSLVIKRYNLKGVGHWLRRCWRPSRAWHSWRNAQRLMLWGLPTPRPVALLESRFGWLCGRAWYVSEYVPGEPLGVALTAASPARRVVLLERLGHLLAGLARLRLSHGDLKATNLLVDHDNQLMLLDLDAMRRHRWAGAFERALARDLTRLRANWADQPALLAQLDRALGDAGLTS